LTSTSIVILERISITVIEAMVYAYSFYRHEV